MTLIRRSGQRQVSPSQYEPVLGIVSPRARATKCTQAPPPRGAAISKRYIKNACDATAPQGESGRFCFSVAGHRTIGCSRSAGVAYLGPRVQRCRVNTSTDTHPTGTRVGDLSVSLPVPDAEPRFVRCPPLPPPISSSRPPPAPLPPFCGRWCVVPLLLSSLLASLLRGRSGIRERRRCRQSSRAHVFFPLAILRALLRASSQRARQEEEPFTMYPTAAVCHRSQAGSASQ